MYENRRQKLWREDDELFVLARCELFTAVVGDIVFSDLDGVFVVPRKAERETLVKALEKARGEKLVRHALEEGMSARDAFRKFRIL